MQFSYRKHDGERTRRMVEPHRLVAWGDRWYLVAWDLERNDWRTWRADRIARLDPTGRLFHERELPDPDITAYVSRNVARAGWRYMAHIEIDAPADEVRRDIDSQVGSITPLPNGRCVLEAGADSLWTIAIWCAAFDREFRVLDPPAWSSMFGCWPVAMRARPELRLERVAPDLLGSMTARHTQMSAVHPAGVRLEVRPCSVNNGARQSERRIAVLDRKINGPMVIGAATIVALVLYGLIRWLWVTPIAEMNGEDKAVGWANVVIVTILVGLIAWGVAVLFETRWQSPLFPGDR